MNNNLADEYVNFKLNKMNKNDKCKNCFCNELCLYLLARVGQVTTCEDFRNRCKKMVDKMNN